MKSKTMLSSILATLLFTIKPTGATASAAAATVVPPSYHLTRILFLRLLAVVYISAFSVAKFQNKGLIGDRGISPARDVLNDSQKRQEQRSARRRAWLEERKKYSSQQQGFWLRRLFVKCKNVVTDSHLADLFRDKFWYRTDRADRPLPCLLWLAKDRNNLNPWLDGLANGGLMLSSIMLATGSANAFLLFALYIIQRSFMSVGGVFYGYGWEPQLAELTFNAMFLVPLLSMNPFFGSKGGLYPVPSLVIWAIRFYLFKIMLGAGLIKVKSSDAKWKPGNLSAMKYFYETQVRQYHKSCCQYQVVAAFFTYFAQSNALFNLVLSLSQILLHATFILCHSIGTNLKFWQTISLSLWHHFCCCYQSGVGE
jgi:hypothetical protein